MNASNHFSLLDILERPAFCVQNGIITYANSAAEYRLFSKGKQVMDFLTTDGSAYASFGGGCLYLNIT